jgi:GSH-dependent disulfide-bond oxidoreductase
MAAYPWIVPWTRQGQNLDDFPHVRRWFDAIRARPATVRAYARADEVNPSQATVTPESAKVLFGQTAGVVK